MRVGPIAALWLALAMPIPGLGGDYPRILSGLKRGLEGLELHCEADHLATKTPGRVLGAATVIMRLRGGYDFYGGDKIKGETKWEWGAATPDGQPAVILEQESKPARTHASDNYFSDEKEDKNEDEYADEAHGDFEKLDENGLEAGTISYDTRAPSDIDEWTRMSDNGTFTSTAHDKEVKVMLVVRRDGEELLVTADGLGTMLVWDAETMKCLHVLHKHRYGVAAMHLSPDGDTLYTGGWDNDIWAWNTRTWACSRLAKGIGEMSHSTRVERNPNAFVSHRGHDAAVLSLCCGRAGMWLASGDMHGEMYVWNLRTLDRVETLKEHVGMLHAMVLYEATDTLYTAGEDWAVIAWNTTTWKVEARWEGHTGPVRCMLCVGDVVFSGSMDCTIRAWDVRTGACAAVVSGHTGWVLGMSVTADCSKMVISCSDGSVYVRETDTWGLLREEARHSNFASCVALLRDDTHVASGGFDMDVIVSPTLASLP